MFKIATWNVNSLRVRLPQVLEWLASERPDALALQETKLKDPDFPFAALQEAGYHALAAGQPTYNGVALLSRKPAELGAMELPGFPDPQRRILAASLGDLLVLNLYVPNGQAVGSEKYAYKLAWLKALHDYVQGQAKNSNPLIILGDFNIAPEDADVHDPAVWKDQVLCSEPERQRLADLLDLGLKDCFRLFEQPPASFSWWDYRAAAFRRNMGLRIDLILCSAALAARCRSCRIDKAPRKAQQPSDHAPVIAEFDLAV